MASGWGTGYPPSSGPPGAYGYGYGAPAPVAAAPVAAVAKSVDDMTDEEYDAYVAAEREKKKAEMRAQIEASALQAKKQAVSTDLMTKLTAEGCPTQAALEAGVAVLDMDDILFAPRIHLALNTPSPTIVAFFGRNLSALLTHVVVKRAMPPAGASPAVIAAANAVTPRQLSANRIIRSGWCLKLLASSDAGMTALYAPFAQPPRPGAGGTESPSKETHFMVYDVMNYLYDEHYDAAGLYFQRNPNWLVAILRHGVIEDVGDMMVLLINRIITRVSSINACEWVAQQFIPTVLDVIQSCQGPHDGTTSNIGRILVQLIGISWRRSFPESIRFAGLPCVTVKHHTLIHALATNHKRLSFTDRSSPSTILASLEILIAIAERPDLQQQRADLGMRAIEMDQFLPDCARLLTYLESNYSQWLGITKTPQQVRSSKMRDTNIPIYDDELKHDLWPIYSRLTTTLMSFFFTMIAHGWANITPIFYYDHPFHLPQRMLHACIRHPLNSFLHYYVGQSLCLLLQTERPDKIVDRQFIELLVSYISPYLQPGTLSSIRPRPSKTDLCHFAPQWYLIADSIRTAATHHPLLQRVCHHSAGWSDYLLGRPLDDHLRGWLKQRQHIHTKDDTRDDLLCRTLDDHLDRLKYHDRSQLDTEEAMKILFGDGGEREIPMLEARVKDVEAQVMALQSPSAAGETKRQPPKASKAPQSEVAAEARKQPSQSITIVSYTLEPTDGSMRRMVTSDTIRCYPQPWRLQTQYLGVKPVPASYVPLPGTTPPVEFTVKLDRGTTATASARRMVYGRAMTQAWNAFLSQHERKRPPEVGPLVLKKFHFNDLALVEVAGGGGSSGVSGEFSMEVLSAVAKDIDGGGGIRMPYTAAAFTHYVLQASRNTTVITNLKPSDEKNGSIIVGDCVIHARPGSPAVAHGAFGPNDQGDAGIQAWWATHYAECRTNPICRWLALPYE